MATPPLPEGFVLDSQEQVGGGAEYREEPKETFSQELKRKSIETASDIGQVYPVLETGAAFATEALSVPVSGLAGLFEMSTQTGDLESAGKFSETIKQAMTYEPQTERGKRLHSVLTRPFQEWSEGASAVADPIAEAGYPNVAAGVKTAIEGGPALIGAKKIISSTPKRVAAKLDFKVASEIKTSINKAIKPSLKGKDTYKGRKSYYKQAESAVNEIIKNKDELNIIDSTGAKVEGLPKTLEQFSQAIDQVKTKLFGEYDSLAKQTTAKTKIDIKRRGLKEAQKRSLKYPLKKGEKIVFDKEGKGRFVESSRDIKIDQPIRTLSVPINLKKISKKLDPILSNKVLQDFSPETIKYAEARMKVMQKRGKYTALDTQNAIQQLNQSLDKYYKERTPAAKGEAMVDALIANNLRKNLDTAIRKTTGKEYGALKKKYGDLSSIEKDVNKRTLIDARKNNKGLIDFSDIYTSHHIVKGILSKEPATATAGVLAKGVSELYKMKNDPNRIIKNMFKNVEKLQSQKVNY